VGPQNEGMKQTKPAFFSDCAGFAADPRCWTDKTQLRSSGTGSTELRVGPVPGLAAVSDGGSNNGVVTHGVNGDSLQADRFLLSPPRETAPATLGSSCGRTMLSTSNGMLVSRSSFLAAVATLAQPFRPGQSSAVQRQPRAGRHRRSQCNHSKELR